MEAYRKENKVGRKVRKGGAKKKGGGKKEGGGRKVREGGGKKQCNMNYMHMRKGEGG